MLDVRAIIPLQMQHLDQAGRVIATGSSLESATTPLATAAMRQLAEYAAFIDQRAPEALDNVRDGLRLVLDERLVDDAVGGAGLVTLGRAGPRFSVEPIESRAVVGHELTHALELGDGNYMSDELNADLVGLAFARATGAGAGGGADAWRIAMVGRDLRSPAYPTVDALKGASGMVDVHLTAGPIGLALARASDRIGIEAIDAIGVDSALREMPRTSAAVGARIDDLIWSGRPSGDIERSIVELSMTDHATGLLRAAGGRDDAATSVAVLREELQRVGVTLSG